jgi:hypothetical protein
MRVYYHPSVGEYAKYDSFEIDHAALAGVPSGIAASAIAGWGFKMTSQEALLAGLAGGGLMAGVFGAFYPKKILSWLNPPPFDPPRRYPSKIPKAVVPSFLDDPRLALAILAYEGEGDAIDHSPNRNNAKLYGVYWMEAPCGWSLYFDGRSYAEIPYSPSLNPGELTIIVWAKVTGGAGTYRMLLDTMNPPKFTGYRLYINTADYWLFAVGDGTRGYYVQGEKCSYGEWTPVATKCSKDKIKIYYKGAWREERLERPYTPSNIPLRIGSRTAYVSPGDFFIGYAALIYIYSVALPDEEVVRRIEAQRPLFT